jgi:hypothetical protein
MQPGLLTLDYIIHCLLNEGVHCDNQEQGKESDEKKEVQQKKDKDNVALSAILSGGPHVCWQVSRPSLFSLFIAKESE